MLWAPPESITSASPRRMISVASPTAWLLAAQAVRQLVLGPWALNMPARWPAGMFGSCSSSAIGCSSSSPAWVNWARSSSLPCRASGHHAGEAIEILLTFAAAQVDAKPGGVDAADRDARVVDGLAWRRRRRSRCAGRDASTPRGPRRHRDVPIANLGRDFGGKVAGVEDRRRPDAGVACLTARSTLFHFGPQRGHPANAGDHNASGGHGALSWRGRTSSHDSRREEVLDPPLRRGWFGT